MKFNVITRCSRPSNLLDIHKSIYQDGVDVEWNILFDTSTLHSLNAQLLKTLSNTDKCFMHYIEGQEGDYLYPQSMQVVNQIKKGYILYIDDDTIVHPDYYKELSATILKNKDYKVFVVDQLVDKKDFTGLDVRIAAPEHTKHQHIDIAQPTFHCSLFEDYSFSGDYGADGLLAEKIHKDHPDWFFYINKTLSYYNYLENPPVARVPKILYIGHDRPQLKTSVGRMDGTETDELRVKYVESDKEITKVIHDFQPDSILTTSPAEDDFPNLSSLSSEFRRKWINDNSELQGSTQLGDLAYNVAMFDILRRENLDIISWVTSMYNTGDLLYRTYDSLKNQTNPNWEWVLSNDSTDQKTVKIAQDIASGDPRVKVFDFNNKSGGIVGEAKYRAMAMAKGFILAELDHDDYLTPWATQLLYDASDAFPDAGFYYTDSCEVDEQWNSLTYGEGFAYGYGSYYKASALGREFEVAATAHINPKTIRHIVGIPNHIRAWYRDVYYAIGGQNRGLAIADDYELVVRTFLTTKMCGIRKLGYIQFMHRNGQRANTQDVSRQDIQRRVRTIMYQYNENISKRFADLGVEDWAYADNPDNPLSAKSRFGEREGYVNYTFKG